jgi:CBS domain-containing protein
MKIRDILRIKGSDIVTVYPNFTVHDAMRLLVEHNIGSVVVAEGGQAIGILTERDVLRLGSQDPTSLRTTKVQDVMTKDLIVGLPDDTLEYVMEIMTKNRIRHLPIVEEGLLEGIVSIGDVVHTLRQSVEAENRYMRDYIQGVVY